MTYCIYNVHVHVFNERWEGRKKEASKVKQTNKAKQHSTPKHVHVHVHVHVNCILSNYRVHVHVQYIVARAHKTDRITTIMYLYTCILEQLLGIEDTTKWTCTVVHLNTHTNAHVKLTVYPHSHPHPTIHPCTHTHTSPSNPSTHAHTHLICEGEFHPRLQFNLPLTGQIHIHYLERQRTGNNSPRQPHLTCTCTCIHVFTLVVYSMYM